VESDIMKEPSGPESGAARGRVAQKAVQANARSETKSRLFKD